MDFMYGAGGLISARRGVVQLPGKESVAAPTSALRLEIIVRPESRLYLRPGEHAVDRGVGTSLKLAYVFVQEVDATMNGINSFSRIRYQLRREDRRLRWCVPKPEYESSTGPRPGTAEVRIAKLVARDADDNS
ncbi:hypothetical protein GQ600_23141 [Phytophthora cactorum]|nr:hypothetical protein GQ600_23141 [Phytophthora cactorum]